jgi:hypothetical protein
VKAVEGIEIARLIEQIADKAFNVVKFVDLAISTDEIRTEFVRQMIMNKQIMTYYHCYYIVSEASQLRPDLFYIYWDDMVLLLDNPNSYHRDMGITILANLTAVDQENKFLDVRDKYYKHFNDEKFMTARCCIQNTKKILKHKSKIIEEVVGMLVDIDKYCRYPEKQRELLKHDIIDVFDEVYHATAPRDKIETFIKAATRSISPKTRSRAREFITKHNL